MRPADPPHGSAVGVGIGDLGRALSGSRLVAPSSSPPQRVDIGRQPLSNVIPIVIPHVARRHPMNSL